MFSFPLPLHLNLTCSTRFSSLGFIHKPLSLVGWGGVAASFPSLPPSYLGLPPPSPAPLHPSTPFPALPFANKGLFIGAPLGFGDWMHPLGGGECKWRKGRLEGGERVRNPREVRSESGVEGCLQFPLPGRLGRGSFIRGSASPAIGEGVAAEPCSSSSLCLEGLWRKADSSFAGLPRK